MENGRSNDRFHNRLSGMYDDYTLDSHDMLHAVANTYMDLKNMEKILKSRIALIEKRFGIKLEE